MTPARAFLRSVATRLAALSLAVAAAGCSVTATDLPLPGGGVEGEKYRLRAEFADALNLPAKAHVKLSGVRVGTVTDISTRDWRARVVMEIRRDVALPEGTRAELRQATPLGDVFVALQPPREPSGDPLGDGDTIGIEHTAAAATVEDTLGALAMLVNGGGLGKLDSIVDELNTAMDGRAPTIRSLTRELTTTLKTLNGRSSDVDRILKSTLKITKLAKKHRGTIDAAFAEFGPAMDTVTANTERLRKLLSRTARTAGSVDQVLGAGTADYKSSVRDAVALLDGFARLGDDLGPNLRSLITLGEFVHGATEGESGAGEAKIDVTQLLTILRASRIPDAEDVSRGGNASFATLLKFLEQVSGGGQ